MTRNITLTAAEAAAWAAVEPGGTFWLARPGELCHTVQCAWSGPPPWPEHDCRCKGQMQPPWSLLALAAPCGTSTEHAGCSYRGAHIIGVVVCIKCGWVHDCPDCRIELVGECPHPLHDTSRKDGGWAVCEPGACSNGIVTLGHAYPVGEVLPLDEMTARMLAFALDAPDWHHLVGQYALKLRKVVR